MEEMSAQARAVARAGDWRLAIRLAGDAADLAETAFKELVNFARTVGGLSDAEIAEERGVTASAVTHRFGPRRGLLQQAMREQWDRPAPGVGPGLDNAERKTALCRWYDAEGSLLFIGIIRSLDDLLSAGHPRWWSQVVDGRMEWFDTLAEAVAAQLAAIASEAPRYNPAPE